MQNYYFAGLILIMSALLASANPAAAEDVPASISGTWAFETSDYRDGTCRMSGKMHIRPSKSQTNLTCSFTAIEECAGSDRWVVEQTCAASRRDTELSISSKIVSFLEAKEFTDSYAPDHFLLNVINKERMTGSLVSAIRAPVEFWREEENLS